MIIDAIIEIHEGSNNKTEIKDGVTIVDRILPIRIPANYGFIPNTLAEDGDALDIFIISKRFLYTHDKAKVNIIGIFECLDQGVVDNKLFGTLVGEKFDKVTILKNLTQVGHYLLNYKSGFEIENYKEFKSTKELNTFMEKYQK